MGWNATDVMLDPGQYFMILEVVVASKLNARLDIGNITLLNENCTFDDVMGEQGHLGQTSNVTHNTCKAFESKCISAVG